MILRDTILINAISEFIKDIARYRVQDIFLEMLEIVTQM